MANIKWIPIDIIQEVIRCRISNAFLIYVLLNLDHNGYTIKTYDLVIALKIKSGFKSPKTIRKHLLKLVEIGWVGYDKSTYYIRSMQYINQIIIKGKTNRVVEFGIIYLDRWKAYLTGAMIGYLAYSQRLKELAEIQRSGFKKMGNPYQRPRVSASYPVSHASIEKILRVSTTTAHQYKQIAAHAGFIKVEPGYRKTNISVESHLLLKSMVSSPNKYSIKAGTVYERLPDQVFFLLLYRGGKKRNI